MVSRPKSCFQFPNPSENLSLNPRWLSEMQLWRTLETLAVKTNIDNWDWQKHYSVSRCISCIFSRIQWDQDPFNLGRGNAVKRKAPALEDGWISDHKAKRNEDQWFITFLWNYSALLGIANFKEWEKIFFGMERLRTTKLILLAFETKRNWKLLFKWYLLRNLCLI